MYFLFHATGISPHSRHSLGYKRI